MPEPETAGGTVGFVPFPPDRAARYRDEGLWTGRPLDTLLRDTTVAAPHSTDTSRIRCQASTAPPQGQNSRLPCVASPSATTCAPATVG